MSYADRMKNRSQQPGHSGYQNNPRGRGGDRGRGGSRNNRNNRNNRSKRYGNDGGYAGANGYQTYHQPPRLSSPSRNGANGESSSLTTEDVESMTGAAEMRDARTEADAKLKQAEESFARLEGVAVAMAEKRTACMGTIGAEEAVVRNKIQKLGEKSQADEEKEEEHIDLSKDGLKPFRTRLFTKLVAPDGSMQVVEGPTIKRESGPNWTLTNLKKTENLASAMVNVSDFLFNVMQDVAETNKKIDTNAEKIQTLTTDLQHATFANAREIVDMKVDQAEIKASVAKLDERVAKVEVKAVATANDITNLQKNKLSRKALGQKLAQFNQEGRTITVRSPFTPEEFMNFATSSLALSGTN